MSSATDFLSSIAGDSRIPGGCDHCDADQTVDKSEAPIFVLRVHHDSWCPTYRRRGRAGVPRR